MAENSTQHELSVYEEEINEAKAEIQRYHENLEATKHKIQAKEAEITAKEADITADIRAKEALLDESVKKAALLLDEITLQARNQSAVKNNLNHAYTAQEKYSDKIRADRDQIRADRDKLRDNLRAELGTLINEKTSYENLLKELRDKGSVRLRITSPCDVICVRVLNTYILYEHSLSYKTET
jgi:chromosome segregation ATPase